MYILISKTNYAALESKRLLGQRLDTYEVVCEVETAPEIEHIEITEEYSEFTQMCVPPIFRTRPAIKEVVMALDKVEYIGSSAMKARTSMELDLLYELKLREEEIEALADIVFGG